MRSEWNAPTKKVPIVGLSFTKMLQRTGLFWSRIYYQSAMWQHWSIPHTFLTWLQSTFICFVEWNKHWRDDAFVMLLISLRMRRKSWKGFKKMASRNISNTITVADWIYICRRVQFWRNYGLNDGNLLYLSAIKWFQEYFETTTCVCVCVCVCVCLFVRVRINLQCRHQHFTKNISCRFE